jgi:hypothetical protein
MNKFRLVSLVFFAVVICITSLCIYYSNYITVNIHSQQQHLSKDSQPTCNCKGNRPGGYWDLLKNIWVTAAENDPFCQRQGLLPCIRFQTISKKDEISKFKNLQDETIHNSERVIKCLSTHRRIVFMGDSVQRGLFWSLVHAIEIAIKNTPSLSHLNSTVKKRFQSKTFTNFQDQDLIVRNSNGNEIFSIRFVYSSNAVDFLKRCDLIHDWFFQCLKTVEDILSLILTEEKERHQHLAFTSSLVKKSLRGESEMNASPSLSSQSPPVGVLYWNTGLWDWRTGLSSIEYKQHLLKIMKSMKLAFHKSFVSNVVWRTTSASWPTKFMNSNECNKKPHQRDSRPCSVHTSDLIDYNRVASTMMKKHGFSIVDSWPITNGRSDLSFDGLHFESKTLCSKDGSNVVIDIATTKEKERKCIEDVSQVYMHLNDMFLNTICQSHS